MFAIVMVLICLFLFVFVFIFIIPFDFFFLRICYYFPSLSGQYLNVNVEKVEFDFMI